MMAAKVETDAKDDILLPRVYVDANKDRVIDVDNVKLEVEPTGDWSFVFSFNVLLRPIPNLSPGGCMYFCCFKKYFSASEGENTARSSKVNIKRLEKWRVSRY